MFVTNINTMQTSPILENLVNSNGESFYIAISPDGQLTAVITEEYNNTINSYRSTLSLFSLKTQSLIQTYTFADQYNQPYWMQFASNDTLYAFGPQGYSAGNPDPDHYMYIIDLTKS